MSRLACPYCGPRELREFHFHKTVPREAGSAFERTYLRTENPAFSVEHWQHLLGCRAWLRVSRNPSTGEVLEVQMLDGAVRHE